MTTDLNAALERVATRRGMQGMLLHGPRGCGKSTILRSLRDEWTRQGATVAYLDLSSFGHEDHPGTIEQLARKAVARLAWDLRLDCRRLVACDLAVGLPLRGLDRRDARNQVFDAWLDYRGLTRRWQRLGQMAERAISDVPQLPWGTLIANIVNTGAVGLMRKGTRTALPQPLRWFADPAVLGTDAKDAETALDQLADLSVNGQTINDVTKQRAVSQIHLLALVADVAEAWGSPAARDRTDQAALLIDNVDTPVGTALLSAWHGARGALERDSDQLTHVPLLLVTTARHDIDVPTDAAGGGPANTWNVVGVPPLAGAQVRERVLREYGELEHDADLIAALVHDLTGGHRGAAHLLLDQQLWRSGNYQPERVLGTGDVEDRLLSCLFDTSAGAGVIDLVCRCAIARSAEQAEVVLSLACKAGDPVFGQVREILDGSAIWVAATDQMPEEATLLRRLLLRRLRRSGSARDDEFWSQLPARLHRGDGESYHRMATGDVHAAASSLRHDLGGAADAGSLARWLRRLLDAAAAPRWGSGLSEPWPHRGLAALWPQPEDGLTASLERILALHAVAGDPLRAVPRAELHRRAATACADLQEELWRAGYSDDAGVLARAVRRQHALAADWQRMESAIPQLHHEVQPHLCLPDEEGCDDAVAR